MNILIYMLLPFSLTAFADDCKQSDINDRYTLALSWLPGICKTKKFPECNQVQNYRYFVLHGLWPEEQNCGEKLSFCGQVKKEEKNFCDYPKISMSSSTYHLLNYFMPNSRYEGCLERHEWWKHGTCTKYDSEEYYRIAIQYATQFNATRFVSKYIQNNFDSPINKKELFEYFDADFGQDAHKSIQLKCENNILTELRISLSKDFMDGKLELKRILKENLKESSCGDQILITY